ncbi:MAG: ABC transporter permease [Bacteroides sp.]|jgi:putative ABC transport system permease protein|nr:ABC transporter permease [Bacteroides sp.]MCI1681873.1 ABC transporter permease [Bacteroides sp.]
MIRHLFTVIWNERKNNGWIWAELFLASICLWFIIDYFYVLGNVVHRPLGYDISHTYRIDMSELSSNSDGYITPSEKKTTTGEDLLLIMERVRHYSGIEAVSLSKSAQPYSATGYSGTMNYQQLYYKDTISITAQEYLVTPSFFEVFHNSADLKVNRLLSQALRPGAVVLSADAKDELMGISASCGEQIKIGQDVKSATLTAICSPVRWSEYFKSNYCFYRLLSEADIAEYINADNFSNYELCVRVDSEHDVRFADNFMLDMSDRLRVGNLYLMEVRPSSILRKAVVAPEESNIMARSILSVFILFNIFLGISGTFMFRTQYRWAEMGLRIAMGSSKAGLRSFLITEGLILLTLAIIPAILVDLNMGVAELIDIKWEPFVTFRFIIGLVCTYLVMSFVIIIGIWYPAYQVMHIEPVDALREE